ncbi:MAG: hypothetical protein OXQ29_11020 [Rhodospirillaceae bacterium]|nr:hypothetical protein [Rhodospirillaceae bacterium]
MRNERPARAMGLAALAACILLAASFQASAQGPSITQQCHDAFDLSPASAYCPNADVREFQASVSAALSSPDGPCLVKSNCSIDVTAGGASWTYSQSFISTGSQLDMEKLDLCFAWRGPGSDYNSYTLHMRPGCKAGEIDSATAAQNGLTRP